MAVPWRFLQTLSSLRGTCATLEKLPPPLARLTGISAASGRSGASAGAAGRTAAGENAAMSPCD